VTTDLPPNVTVTSKDTRTNPKTAEVRPVSSESIESLTMVTATAAIPENYSDSKVAFKN
jgi:hypothetical protein